MISSEESTRVTPRRARVYGLLACQGDSLTFGSRDPDAMSYPLYLGRRLSERHRQTWVAVNFAVPADGWAEIWRRNYMELLSVPEAGEVCLWAGTNDAWKKRSFREVITACEGVLVNKVVDLIAADRTYEGQTFADELHFVCPWHGYEYDIKTGECAGDRKLKLRKYEVVRRGDDIFVVI